MAVHAARNQACRVQRSRWTPKNLGTTRCMAWYDGNDPTTGSPSIIPVVPVDGANPAQWDDKSGNARHLNNQVSAPVYKANQLGARGVMRFDGVDDYYYMTAPYMFGNGTVEVWAVVRSNESGTGAIFCESRNDATNTAYRLYDDDTNNDYIFNFENNAGTTRFSNNQDRQTNLFDLVIAQDNGAATGTSVEVVDVDSGTTGAYTRDAITMNRLSVGANLRGAASLFLDGDIAEIVVLPTPATSSERALLMNYFNTKFGRWWTPT